MIIDFLGKVINISKRVYLQQVDGVLVTIFSDVKMAVVLKYRL